jgi:hypothetical protein
LYPQHGEAKDQRPFPATGTFFAVVAAKSTNFAKPCMAPINFKFSAALMMASV